MKERIEINREDVASVNSSSAIRAIGALRVIREDDGRMKLEWENKD